MNKSLVGIACLVAGVILLVMGFSANDSISSDVSRFFSGAPTDRAMWLLIGGGVLSVIGLGSLLTGRSR